MRVRCVEEFKMEIENDRRQIGECLELEEMRPDELKRQYEANKEASIQQLRDKLEKQDLPAHYKSKLQ